LILACAAVFQMPLFAQSKAAGKPTAVERGKQTFTDFCATCHGETATGGRGPDLVHSPKVLQDKKGEILTPLIEKGNPPKGMPALGLTKAEIADVVAFLHAQAKAAKGGAKGK
jgi:cytochrome c oxidase cbb3-type subunit 3